MTEKSILDMIAETKEVEEKELKEKLENPVVSDSKGRKTDLKVLYYDINESDNELSRFVKNLINESEVTNQQVYDYFGRELGYNMIYSLYKKSIAWNRVKNWCDFLGYDIILTLERKKK